MIDGRASLSVAAKTGTRIDGNHPLNGIQPTPLSWLLESHEEYVRGQSLAVYRVKAGHLGGYKKTFSDFYVLEANNCMSCSPHKWVPFEGNVVGISSREGFLRKWECHTDYHCISTALLKAGIVGFRPAFVLREEGKATDCACFGFCQCFS